MKIIKLAVIVLILFTCLPVFSKTFRKCKGVEGWTENLIPDKYKPILKTNLYKRAKFAAPLSFTNTTADGEHIFYYKVFVLNLGHGSSFNEDLVIIAQDVNFPDQNYMLVEMRWWENDNRMYWSNGSCFLDMYTDRSNTVRISINSLW